MFWMRHDELFKDTETSICLLYHTSMHKTFTLCLWGLLFSTSVRNAHIRSSLSELRNFSCHCLILLQGIVLNTNVTLSMDLPSTIYLWSGWVVFKNPEFVHHWMLYLHLPLNLQMFCNISLTLYQSLSTFKNSTLTYLPIQSASEFAHVKLCFNPEPDLQLKTYGNHEGGVLMSCATIQYFDVFNTPVIGCITDDLRNAPCMSFLIFPLLLFYDSLSKLICPCSVPEDILQRRWHSFNWFAV